MVPEGSRVIVQAHRIKKVASFQTVVKNIKLTLVRVEKSTLPSGILTATDARVSRIVASNGDEVRNCRP
jgi:hypothetical protein